MKSAQTARDETWLVLTHPGFIALLSYEPPMVLLTMSDHEGRIWTCKGPLLVCIARAMQDLNLTE